MKLIASNPIVHGDVANYKAMVYKMILPSDISQPPTIELYQRGVTVSQYTPNFGNGIPADFYTDLHTVQINWEIEGMYDACYFGVIYNRNWVAGTPVVFTEMYYNSRENRQVMRELCLLRAEGVISPEDEPVDVPTIHAFVNENGYIYSSTTPWNHLNNPVVTLDDQPIDTFLKIRVIAGHYNVYTNLAVHQVGGKQSYTFFVPDNYLEGGGCGCGGGDGTVDLSALMARFDNLDAAVFAVKQDTASTNTLANNIEYLSNEIQDKVNRVDQGMPMGFNMIGAKVDLIGSKVDTAKTASDDQFTGIHSHVTSLQNNMTSRFDSVNDQFDNTRQVVQDQATSIRDNDNTQFSAVQSSIGGVHNHMSDNQDELRTLLAAINGVPQNVIDMIMDLHAEALGSWSWDKRTSLLTMFDTHGLEVATFSVTDTPDVASRERRTDLEVS